MTRDQRFWRLLTLLEDYYTTGERTAGPPPPVRLPPAAATAATAGRQRAPAPAGQGAPAADTEGTPAATPAAAGQADSLAAVAREVARCRACGLCERRTRTVPGEGVPRPRLMVIGEGPGHGEDRTGRPFVGPAGQYLDRWLAAINLSRTESCFITNVVKCRPPNNRDPLPDEANACRPFLQRQIRLLRPRALLTVGRIASQLLTGSDAPMGALRGQVYRYRVPGLAEELPLVTTYHPSGVLRNPSLRRAVWDDLRMVARILTDGSA